MNAEQLADRLAVEATLYTFADAIDRRDWPQYRSVFTDEIDLDSSSYRPGTVGRVGADEWVDRATRLFPDHVLVNHYGDHVFTIAGYYDDRLVRTSHGWRIQSKKLVVRWSEGNRHIMQLAAEKAAAVGHGQ